MQFYYDAMSSDRGWIENRNNWNLTLSEAEAFVYFFLCEEVIVFTWIE